MIEGSGPSPTIGRRPRVLPWAEAHRGVLTALIDALVWPLALDASNHSAQHLFPSSSHVVDLESRCTALTGGIAQPPGEVGRAE